MAPAADSASDASPAPAQPSPAQPSPANRERVAVIRGTFSLSHDALFVFTPAYAGSGLSLSDDLCSVSTVSGSQALVLGSKGFQRGVHYWEVKVESQAQHGNIFIGMAIANTLNTVSRRCGFSLNSWAGLAQTRIC